MTLETFFEKFELFADAPDAEAKVRELVLDWAVTGKLCHTDSAEWSEGVLGDVIELISGQHLLGHEHNAEGRGIPYLTGPSDFGEKNPIPTRWTEQPKVTAKPGDILITVKGSGVGKTNVLVDQPTAISRQLMAIRVTGAEPEFVHLVLKRAAEHFLNTKIGIAIPGIGRREVLSLKVVLPSLAEQKRIVAKVDELMALCDRLEAQQQERAAKHTTLARASLARFADAPTPANLNLLFHKSYSIPPTDLRKSILTLAVQGKLVPQDPNDEPATRLLAQIAEEKRRLIAVGTIRDKKGPLPITEDELPFGVPSGWEWTRVSSITRRIHYGYTASAKSELKDVRLLRITDIQNNFVDWPSVPGCEIAKDDVGQYRLGRGDILVARTGGTVGKTYLVQDVPVVAVFASYLIRIQGATSLLDRYLKLFLESPTYWVQLEEGARGAAQPNVNGQTLGNMVVPIPPLAEQRRIVAKVDELMALVDQLETQLAHSRGTAEKLMEAVVAELTT